MRAYTKLHTCLEVMRRTTKQMSPVLLPKSQYMFYKEKKKHREKVCRVVVLVVLVCILLVVSVFL